MRTKRYLTLVLCTQTRLVFLFLKRLISFTFYLQNFNKMNQFSIFFFNHSFTRTYWRFFKKIKNHKYGLVTNNLTKSSIFWTLQNLYTLVSANWQRNVTLPVTPSLVSLRYYRPFKVLGFAFQKSTFNTLMFYIFLLLSTPHFGHMSSFMLRYGFLWFPGSFKLYMFVNFFYFKLRHY